MTTKALQLAMQEAGQDRARRSDAVLSRQRLLADNGAYVGTGGVSQENRHLGLTPGYLDTTTGVALPSRYANGIPAPIHVLDGLPPSWVSRRDRCGRVLQARAGIIAGFLRDGRFYTRDQAAALTLH